ncbi:hypothetical protein UlMin_013912 [Ulmus minor]
MASIQNPMANGELGAVTAAVDPHFVVPVETPAGSNVKRGRPRGSKGTARGSDEKTTTTTTSSSQNRTSSRILDKQRAERELRVRRRVELLDDAGKGDGGGEGKSENGSSKRKFGEENGEVEAVEESQDEGLGSEKGDEPNNPGSSGGGSSSANVAEKSDYAKVKETLRLFNKHYLRLVQEEEKRCAKGEASSMIGDEVVDTKNKAKRPDLKAITEMRVSREILYPVKRIGNIPGVDVGHQFYSRAEMVVVGFHSHWLNGIDYMGQSYSKGHKNYNFPLAVAIVLSGMYEDDLDNAEDVVYTGQGGHNLTGDKRQIQDQKLDRGNLALKNCVEQDVPVRVVRGHDSASSYTRKVYTYDGLYKVVKYWAEKGISGFTVFKYRLRRLEGQPILTTNQVHFAHGRVPESLAEIRGLVCEDITGGQENIPIPATNLVDDPPISPTGYTYRKSVQVAKNVKLPQNVGGCNCKGTCVDSKTCACARLNGFNFPYVHLDGGRLVEAKDVVFECGPQCGCGPDCVNRTSQKGLKYRFEVFRTPKKGWAVRSWDFIRAGAPICEYTGILKRTEDVDSISGNDYIFDIDCLQTMKGLDGRKRRSCDASMASDSLDQTDEKSDSIPEFCIDAGSTGNIARFINHSCAPNLFVQCVLSSHHDMKLARVMLFAADNIPPLQELTYDYGYALDSVLGPDGKVRKMYCYCGAADCKKRLF